MLVSLMRLLKQQELEEYGAWIHYLCMRENSGVTDNQVDTADTLMKHQFSLVIGKMDSHMELDLLLSISNLKILFKKASAQ